MDSILAVGIDPGMGCGMHVCQSFVDRGRQERTVAHVYLSVGGVELRWIIHW